MLGVCLVSLPGNLSALARELQVSVFAVVSSIWPWFWRFVVVAAFAGVLGLRWRASLPYVAGTACVTGVLYAAVMLPMIMGSHLRGYLPSQATRLWDDLCRRFSWSSAATVGQELEAPKNL
jgi:hypothetical protein